MHCSFSIYIGSDRSEQKTQPTSDCAVKNGARRTGPRIWTIRNREQFENRAGLSRCEVFWELCLYEPKGPMLRLILVSVLFVVKLEDFTKQDNGFVTVL